MKKVHLNLTIDFDVHKHHSETGTNFSQVVNKHLGSLMKKNLKENALVDAWNKQ